LKLKQQIYTMKKATKKNLPTDIICKDMDIYIRFSMAFN
jgi:hypothetical protein